MQCVGINLLGYVLCACYCCVVSLLLSCVCYRESLVANYFHEKKNFFS